MIRVALVDDETLVRQGIRSLLEVAADFRVVGEAADGQTGLALLSSAAVDVGLLDVRLPDISGIEVLQQLRARRIAAPIILLTTFDDDEAALAGIAAGAVDSCSRASRSSGSATPFARSPGASG